MAKRNSKKSLSFFSKKSRSTKRSTLPLTPIPGTDNGSLAQESSAIAAGGGATPKLGKKKTSRFWLRFDRTRQSEILEFDETAIIGRASIPARDLRILGPIFPHSSNILAREKAMVANLEFVKAIVTVEEALLLDPLSKEMLPFVDQLRQQIPFKRPIRIHGNEGGEGETKLPFEFQVLEVALEVVYVFGFECCEFGERCIFGVG